MAGAVPHEVLGLAVFVDVLSLIATLLGLLLCYMLWSHGERVSYILMLSASTTLGALVGLVRHIDFTLNWRDIEIERFEAARHHSYSQSDMFGKADVGWRSVLSWVSKFTYNVDALLVLFWSIALFIGTWDIRIKSERKRIMSIVFKTSAVILPVITCVLCSSDIIQSNAVAYLVIFNFLMAVCLTTGSLLVVIVLLKYLQSRNVFTRIFPKSTVSTTLGGGTMSSVATSRTRTGTDKWLIIRFTIIMIVLLIFEAAQIIYQIVNYQRNQHEDKTIAASPDFNAEQAQIDLAQDIPGILPSIIAFLIFGTTAPFRRKYAQICCCRRRRKARSRKDPIPWMMLQPQPQAEVSCSSFADDVEMAEQQALSEEGKPGIRVKTEITTSSISSAVTAMDSPFDGVPKLSKDETRRVSFGGTTIQEPATPPVAYSNPSTRRPSSPRRHSRTLSPIIRADSLTGSPNAQQFGSWGWTTHSRQASLSRGRQSSVSHNRQPSTSPSRRPSVSSTHSQGPFRNPSWTAPVTPTRTHALPLLPEIDTENTPTSPRHRRNPSSPRSPRSSRDDPLYPRPTQSPRESYIPPVPRIPAPTEWQRDSTATMDSSQPASEFSRRGSLTSQTTLISSPRRLTVVEARPVVYEQDENPSWLTESLRSSTASSLPPGALALTSAGRPGPSSANLASAFDPVIPRAGENGRAKATTGAAQMQQEPGNESRRVGGAHNNSPVPASAENLGPTPAPHHPGSPQPTLAVPPNRRSPGGWI